MEILGLILLAIVWFGVGFNTAMLKDTHECVEWIPHIQSAKQDLLDKMQKEGDISDLNYGKYTAQIFLKQ